MPSTQAQAQAPAQHWSGRRRWASAANSHARGAQQSQTQTQKVQTQTQMHGHAAAAVAVVTPPPPSSRSRKATADWHYGCDLDSRAAPSPRSPASASTAASSALFSQTTAWSSPASATPTSASASSSRASAEARSRIHERRIAALRDCGNYAAADILERAVRRANAGGGSNSGRANAGAAEGTCRFIGGGEEERLGGANGDEEGAGWMAAAGANINTADDASVLTFATEATDTVVAAQEEEAADMQVDVSDATDVRANGTMDNVKINNVNVSADAYIDIDMHASVGTNAGAQGALATPEKTAGPAVMNAPETVPAPLLDSSLLDSSSSVSATSSPMGEDGGDEVVPEEQATKEKEEEEEEEEEETRRDADAADFQEAMRLAMAAAEARVVEAERIAIVAINTERSERIAAAEAESVRLLERQRRPPSSSPVLVSAGSNGVVSMPSDDDEGVDNCGACLEDATHASDGQGGTSTEKKDSEEKDSNLSGSDCPLNYSISSDGDGRVPSEVSSPVRSELPLVEDASTEPDQSTSPSSTLSSSRKKLWGKSARKSPSQKWGQSTQENTTSPASRSGTEEGGTDNSFSSRRSGIDDAIANLSERMFSAVSAALPPRHPVTEAEQKVVDSLPRPDYLPGCYGRKDSDASAAPSLRSMASSATPVAGAGTRDVSSLWDTGADASSALSGGTNAKEEDKMAFGDRGGVELSNLDRLEPEMARDLNLAGNAFHTTLKSRTMEHDATSSIDIEVGSMGEVEVFSPKISGRPTKDDGGKRKGDLFMDCNPSSSSSRAGRSLAKLMPSGCRSWCLRIPCPRKVKPVHSLFLLIPIVSIMLYLCYVYFVQPNL